MFSKIIHYFLLVNFNTKFVIREKKNIKIKLRINKIILLKNIDILK